MPLYEFICPNCNHLDAFVKSMGDNDQDCPACEEKMRRILSPCYINMGPVPIGGYYDDNLETFIHSNRHRREVMRERGVTEKGGTPKPDGEAWV